MEETEDERHERLSKMTPHELSEEFVVILMQAGYSEGEARMLASKFLTVN